MTDDLKIAAQHTDFALTLTVRNEISLPIRAAQAQLTNVNFYQHRAAEAGIVVLPVGPADTPLEQQIWQVDGLIRGRNRSFTLEVAEHRAPVLLSLLARQESMEVRSDLQLFEAGPRLTRATFSLSLRPKSFAAKLLVQSLRLSRPRLTRRLNKRFGQFCRQTARDWRRSRR